MPSLDDTNLSSPHWRSLNELADSPRFRAFVEAEFPAEVDPAGLSRRRWLQLMGASLALAGCRWDQREIRPFAHRPPNRVPGKPQAFATAMDLAGSAIGLLVTSVDGRPIKVEGNPKHPQSLGATDLFAQATILELYDPDRSRTPHQRTPQGDLAQTWDRFNAFAQPHFQKLRASGGAGLRVLAEADSSPTLAVLRAKLLAAMPKAAWLEYEPLSNDNLRAGARLAFGKVVRPLYTLDKAEVIVALDADLLSEHPAAVQHARALAKGREVTKGAMNRLYAVEARYSLTGTMADHRLRLPSGQVASVIAALEQEVSSATDLDIGSVKDAGRLARFVRALSRDLKAVAARKGHSLVVAGPSQPAEVHAAVHRINAALGNVGTTVTYVADADPDRPSHFAAIGTLAAEMAAGKVDTLVILGGNPVYNAPADLKFAEAMKKVPTSIHLSRYRDETSRQCAWHLPQAHFLEAWGDARSYDGTYSIIQPLIEPIWGGRSSIEVVAGLLGLPPKGFELVRATFKEGLAEKGDSPLFPTRKSRQSPDFETAWRTALHDGLVEESQWHTESPSLASSSGPAPTGTTLPKDDWTGGPLEIVFARSATLYDGRFANNGWLQETPDPMTKLTWDNAALLSPATAQKLGVADETLVRLKVGSKEIEIPAYILPGLAAGTVMVSLGYGRRSAGQVGGSEADAVAAVGVDLYALRQSQSPWFAPGAIIEPTGTKYALASTQDHFAIDRIGQAGQTERLGELVREATLEHYKEHPEFAQHAVHHPPLISLWEETKYEGRRWGMSIDLSKCTGCNACMVACQAENNVPIVGKARVLEGRQMHWIRVDRYFRGDTEDPAVSHQVVTCHHCENAPCEQVCPVMATVHTAEGLNDMVYNRCVGTRYCSNNCPYKVRRFNFFNYHKDIENPDHEVLKMIYNPDVTVRSRGVMEKCTYCVQRIQAVKIDAKNHQRPIRDGEIKTACQQVCPSQAIEFGDLGDPESQVRQAHAADRAYGMLAELNVKPRTAFLARIRNPNPELEG